MCGRGESAGETLHRKLREPLSAPSFFRKHRECRETGSNYILNFRGSAAGEAGTMLSAMSTLSIMGWSSYQSQIPNGSVNGKATGHNGDSPFRWAFKNANYQWTTALRGGHGW